MKWFKHISDSLDDPLIFDLIKHCGGDGYLTFFGVLEIYAREFRTELGWKLRITRAYLKKKLVKRQLTLTIKSLELLRNSGKWEVEYDGEYIIIFIPKFRELLDESTLKKLRESEHSFRNCSGVIPKIEGTDKEEDKELDKDKDLKGTSVDDRPFQIPSKDEISEESIPKLKSDIDAICKKLYDEKIFPQVHAFKNTAVKQKKNLRSILHTLIRCSLSQPDDPWAFCAKIIELESMNYNERDNRKNS